MKDHHILASVACSVGALSILTFQASKNYEFTYDDYFAIVLNPMVRRDETKLSEVFRRDFWGNLMDRDGTWTHKSWRPLPTLLYRFAWSWCDGDHAELQYCLHVMNVLVNALVSGLVVLATHKLLAMLDEKKTNTKGKGRADRGARFAEKIVTSGVAGALFALHPAHVEVVGNITHGTELGSALFVFSGLLFWASCKMVGSKTAIVVGGLGGLAFLCKETGIMLLPFLAFSECLVVRRSGCKTFAAVLVAIFSIFVSPRFLISGGTSFSVNEEYNPLLKTDRWSAEWWWGVGEAHFDALGLVLWPWWKVFTFDRVFGEDCGKGLGCALKVSVVAMYSGAMCASAICWKMKEAASTYKVFLLGIFFFVLFFVPASHLLFPVGFYVAERTLFLPSYGIVLAFAGFWEW